MEHLNELFKKLTKRIVIVTGHYGSGKTEFSVSLAMQLAAANSLPYKKKALVDLDIANPYFRSRERRDLLENAGYKLYGSAYDYEITAELPALGSNIRAAFDDEDCFLIVDSGGNDNGALILNQFSKYFQTDSHLHLCVVNANRPETRTLEGAASHIAAIETVTGVPVDGIINNCHLLRETTADTVARGHKLCTELCAATGKQLFCDCYPAELVSAEDAAKVSTLPFPMGLHMRATWLDK